MNKNEMTAVAKDVRLSFMHYMIEAKADITRKELADQLGVSESSIRNYEKDLAKLNGQVKYDVSAEKVVTSVEDLVALAARLDEQAQVETEAEAAMDAAFAQAQAEEKTAPKSAGDKVRDILSSIMFGSLVDVD